MLKNLRSKIRAAAASCIDYLKMRVRLAWNASMLEAVQHGLYVDYTEVEGTELERFAPFRRDLYDMLGRAIVQIDKLRRAAKYREADAEASRVYAAYVAA